jgi:hypothetical protein
MIAALKVDDLCGEIIAPDIFINGTEKGKGADSEAM